ncbi:MAG: Response regulator UvrY [Phycisphaerae bacterium]|nr:Response regulator UvrY [Phycisphaerae bacterium]
MRHVETQSCAALAARPDSVAHADVVAFGMDSIGTVCFSTARTIGNQDRKVRIVLYCGKASDCCIGQALASGAHGIVTQADSLENLLTAIRQVCNGGWYFSPAVQPRIEISDGHARLATPSPFAALSPRELEVLNYLATGSSKKEIALKLSLSVGTINNHAANLMRKLDCHDRVELTRLAIREGLVPP